METYEEIYNRMKSEYIAQSGSDFNEEGDIAVRMRVLAGEIYNAAVNAEWLKNQMYVATASGECLDYFASQRGLERKPALKAQGELSFCTNEPAPYDIFIPLGTCVSTSDSEPVRFVTTEEGRISKGGTMLSVWAEAEKPGSNGNIAIEEARIIVNAPAEVDYAYNGAAYKGGTDEETDDELRARIQDSFLVPSNGTNAAYYKKLALSVSGITKAGVVAKLRGTGTVDVFVSNGSNTVQSTAVAEAQSLISKNRELNVDVLVSSAQPYTLNLDVTVTANDGYSTSDVQKKSKAIFTEYLDSLDIGSAFYLTELGKRLMNTGYIKNYVFGDDMSDAVASGSQCFKAGTMTVGVN